MIIITTGEYKPVITDANKLNDNPVIIDSTKKIPVKGYSISSKKINTGFDVEPIVPAQMIGEPLTKLYNALVKIGMGTYTTPYGELWYNNLRSKEYSAGLRFKHLSSSSTLKDHGFAGFSDNELSLYGKKFLKEHSLVGNFDYARNVVHFYGYDTDLHTLNRGATEQRFNYFAANTQLISHYTKAERYNHDIKLSYYNLSDYYKSAENNIRANGMVQTTISKELFKVNAAVDYYNFRTANDTSDNTIITLNPNFIATGEKYRASLGVTAVMDVFVQSKFYFYPNVDLSYNVFENIIVPYVGATGALKKNSFKSVTDENPFVLSSLTLNNTNKKYELFGGIRGTLSSTLAFNARASYAAIDNLMMFVNDSKDLLGNRFDVIYDNSELLNIRGEISYQNREKLRINLRGEYFNYKMENEIRAWYKPQVEITLSANYNLREKIIVKADLFYVDVQYAKTYVADTTSITGTKVVATELKGLFDANLGVEYRYNKKLGFFINLNNIAGVRYNRWMNYPTQKLSVMGGLSYSF
ncbi:MAG: hypothetical protein M3R27_10980 [Bacteroidota bacterium]|nr:hypothetical protein [Bacteroidota bacterium]